MIHPLTQWHLLPVLTLATCLRCIGWVHANQFSASLFRFARELIEERRPRHVTDRFRQTMVMNQMVHLQIFDTDHSEPLDDLPTLLMGKRLALELHALVDPCQHLAVRASLWSPFLKCGVFALHLGQSFLFVAKEARVLDFFASGEGCKGLEPHINPHRLSTGSKTLRLSLYRETGGPLACRGTRDRTGLEGAFDGAMVNHLETANLGEARAMIVRNTEATLRKSETIVAIRAPKPGVARFLARFHPTKECFKRQIDADRNILQDLRVDLFEGGALLFQKGEGVLLLIEREAGAVLRVGGFACFQQMVIEPTALIESLVELSGLFFRGIDTVLVGFTHKCMVAHTGTTVKQQAISCQRKRHSSSLSRDEAFWRS